MGNSTVFDVDSELMAGFIDEAQEGLATLDSLFVKLEAEPTNLDIINAIFRPVHTIKGNSAFFGLMKVKELAHEMETLLGLAKKENKLVPNQSTINVLLTGVDQLKEMLARTRDGQSEIEDETCFNELIEKIISARETKGDTDALWTELFDKLEKVKTDFAELDSTYAKQLDAVIAVASRLKTNKPSTDSQPDKTQVKAQPDIPEPLQKVKSILDQHRGERLGKAENAVILENLTALKELTSSRKAAEIMESVLDEYHRIVESDGAVEALLVELLQEKIEALVSLDDWKTASGSSKIKSIEPKPKATTEKTKPAEQARKTMRVTEDSIDNFLSHVGELIVVGEMYNYLQKTVSESDLSTKLATDFRRVNETFDNLSDNLQKSIMEIRKMPVRVVLQKVPRMVRDIAKACGKEVNVELHGEDIEIDKRLIETLDAPLTHMVRNAVDHGIEMPDSRQTSGKSRQGTVCVSVTETADDITLTISDDGKGLDLETIRAKAVELGLAKPGQELTQDQITDMIFTSGFSTAEKVTEVSGRGVGMDVVNRNIVAAKGKITIDIKAGQGTKFSIRLPKTISTQIIDGFLARLGCNCYVIPMDKVQEVFRPEPQNVSSITGKGECVLRHGELLPVIRLTDVFGNFSSSDEQGTDRIMVSASTGKKRMALCVDDVIGVQKVVLKELDGLELNSQLYSAAAVMGDGTVAMVLDIDCLNRMTTEI